MDKILSYEELKQKIKELEESAVEAGRLQAALRESEEKYRVLVENAADIIFRTDASGCFIFFNPAALKFTGYAQSELIGKHYTALIRPDYRGAAERFYGIQFVKNTPLTYFEFPLLNKNNEEVWIGQQVQIIVDHGVVSGFYAIARDITERKKAEDKLRYEEHLFRTLAEQSSDVIILVNREMMITYENPAIEKVLGYTAEERVGSHLFDHVHPDDLILITDASQMLAKDKQADTLHAEVRVRHQDGSWRIIEVTANNIVQDEFIQGGLVNLHDITERKAVEKTLKESEAQYRLLADHMKDQIWLMDLNLMVTYISPSVERLLGYTLDEIKKLELDKLLTTGSLKIATDFLSVEMPAAMVAPLPENLIRTLEMEFLCKNGQTVWGEIKFSLIRDGGGKPVSILGEGRDITERMKIAKELRDEQKRFRALAEQSSDIIVMVNRKGVITYENPASRILGINARERIGASSLDNIHPDDLKSVKDEFTKLFKDINSPIFRSEVRIRHQDGSWRIFEVMASVLSQGDIVESVIANLRDITERKKAEFALLENQKHLQKENIRLRSSIGERYRFCDIIGKSRSMQEVYEFILQAATTQAHVIIYGESGTGKELVAKAIHETGDRGRKSFVTVHCGAIPEMLMESEFFGYKKGAFTGANVDKRGYLDEADGGTLFLDEVGEVGLNMQVKLLRTIAGDGYTPVGSSAIRQADVRIIAATNRNLRDMVKRGIMREDFFYRIHILPIYLPPLRERKDDLPLLVDHFLNLYDKSHPPLPGNIMEALLNYEWPGNIRELQNVLHRYLTLKRLDFAGGPAVQPIHDSTVRMQEYPVIKDISEKDHILKILSEHNWRCDKAAEALGVNRKTLFRKMKKFGLLNS